VFAASGRRTDDALAPAVQRSNDELQNCCDSDSTRQENER